MKIFPYYVVVVFIAPLQGLYCQRLPMHSTSASFHITEHCFIIYHLGDQVKPIISLVRINWTLIRTSKPAIFKISKSFYIEPLTS